MDKLLKILSENSAYTTAQLALMLDEPEDYIKAQIKEYEDSGVIRGYQAMVNWDSVPDAGVMAIIELKVTPQKEKGFDEIYSYMTKDNIASSSLAASVGMKRIDEFVDEDNTVCFVYKITKEEYIKG